MALSSTLDSIPLSMQRQFPDLTPRHLDHLKTLIAKGKSVCAGGDKLPDLLDDISEQQLNNMMAAVSVAAPGQGHVPVTAVEWADQIIICLKNPSYGEGEWKTLPFQIAIMNCMGNDLIRTVNLIKSARVGYTKMLLGWSGILLSINPETVLLFSPRILPLKIL